MRQLTDAARLREFMRLLGRRTKAAGRVYLVGGACAVLHNWRATTVDIDIDLDPALDLLLREITAIKEELQVNVELESPAHFIPELPGWRDRSPFVVREGTLDFHHYDFHAQALAKIERAHARDVEDVREMAARALIEPNRMVAFFDLIEPQMYRYPAIDVVSFRSAVTETARALAA
jgi:hypothetical protein